ncbi:thymidylate synthase [Streptomyces sp. SL13]|uniref:Thymidylate synthase n=1 Tax=Streptantibioticus silvisoli TaxID=2705255 RepID=A0AA90K701_9ACTN|nr:thymidylate synthase [Streptantibioticus silvisoli]MDI5968383.1 thymidylate synthase [Streptantibioticus silvisoli]
MLAPPAFASFEQAYAAVLRHVNDNHEYANSPRGNDSRECIGVSFQLADPRQRTPFLAARPINPVYHFAEALWYLGGRRDLDMIAHYAPRRRADSRDGTTIDGSAYGFRIFSPDAGRGRSAFDRVLALLRSEKDSKRAFLPVFRHGDLDDPASPDVPCLLGLHLLAREGRLHMVAFMRANDADRGLIADVFSFTLIQEFTAALLGLQLGTYTHHVGSMHLGTASLERVGRVLAEADAAPDGRPRFTVPPMPTGTAWEHVTTVLEHELLLRKNRVQYSPADVAELGLPAYWQRVLLLFEAHRQIVHREADPVEQSVLEALEPGARWQVERRWPGRMPASAVTR